MYKVFNKADSFLFFILAVYADAVADVDAL
jgi:hypothetical protein